MKASKVRVVVAAVVFIVLCIGLIAGVQLGTLSGFGWGTVAALCPLGALTTMIATKTLVPHAVVSIVAMALLVLLVGRAFCGWACPVPLLERARGFFRSPKRRRELERARREEIQGAAKSELGCGRGCGSCGSCGEARAEARARLDSRHYVLGGALLSAAVFGFPVFCLVCPIGLSFATVLLLWRLFAAGDMTWSVVLIPAMLVVELVLLRKWCSRICPLAGLMNLASRFSRTWRPVIDDAKCLETAKGTPCSLCAVVCEADINLRHPELGERSLADCTRCRACVDACPSGAVSMPFLARKGAGAGPSAVRIADGGAGAAGASAGPSVARIADEGGAGAGSSASEGAAGVGACGGAAAATAPAASDVRGASSSASGGEGAAAASMASTASTGDARLDGGGEESAR